MRLWSEFYIYSNANLLIYSCIACLCVTFFGLLTFSMFYYHHFPWSWHETVSMDAKIPVVFKIDFETSVNSDHVVRVYSKVTNYTVRSCVKAHPIVLVDIGTTEILTRRESPDPVYPQNWESVQSDSSMVTDKTKSLEGSEGFPDGRYLNGVLSE